MSRQECGNESPFSPKCRGRSCPYIQIIEGESGEFYVTRSENYGNENNENGNRNYSDNENAMVMFPASGWLTVVLMDAPDDDDTVHLFTNALKHTNDDYIDMKTKTVGEYTDLVNEESVVEW